MNISEIIKKELIPKGTKLKYKYPSISERLNGNIIIQKIKNIYQLKDEFKNFFLIITKEKKKQKRNKYYLAILLATQSSDLLVKIAKKIIQEQKNIRILQFSIHPKHFRVSLILLIELDEFTGINETKELLKKLRSNFIEILNNFIK